MAAIRAYTTIEQSRKLAEILPLESADMCYVWDYENMCYTPELFGFIQNQDNEGVEHIDYPCWSLAALISVLPEGWSSVLTKSFDGEDYYCKLDGEPIETMADNPVDACYELILKLHELKML